MPNRAAIFVVLLVVGCDALSPSPRAAASTTDPLDAAPPSATPSPTESSFKPGAPSPLLRTMRYRPLRQRPSQLLGHQAAKAQIQRWAEQHPDASLDAMIRYSLDYTREALTFVFEKAERIPSQLLQSRKANCVGYAALFNAVFSEVVKRRGLSARYRADHLVAKISVAGKSVHGLIDSPFFRDHDYNRVVDLKTGDKLYVDPSVYEYAGIVYVNSD